MEAPVTAARSLGRAVPAAPRPFRTAAVLGAGTMGAQIAAHLANAGLHVDLLDLASADGGSRSAAAERGLAAARKASPAAFFSAVVAARVRTGNFDDHFDRVGQVDWVIEAVVERLDVKRALLERIEATARPDAVVSTNTSGLPIAEIAEGRSEAFRRRFLGTHFFNPPRYLKLLELIPTADTDPAVLDRVAHFGRVHLGKGIVVAHDRPYFIGNRVGVYGMLRAVEQFTAGAYSIEEIDALTGPLVGRPKSATFRTADLVGLDVLAHVAQNLYEKVPDDECRDAFAVPEVLKRLVAGGALGEKTRAGFYRKTADGLRAIDPATGDYAPLKPVDLGDLEALRRLPLEERLRALFADEGRAGRFFRDTTLDLAAYSARRIPEITDNPADLDRAIRWGFGWQRGPFELWDLLGFEAVVEAMTARGLALPPWIDAMRAAGHHAFYRDTHGRREVYLPDLGSYVLDETPPDEPSLAAVHAAPERTLWRNDEAALLDLGDGVALYEFRSKANTLGHQVMRGLVEAIERVEADPDLRGLVVGNEGTNFSVGANLGEVAMTAAAGQFGQIEQSVAAFQQAVQRIRYATKPVVVAVHERVLGGGCEMAMACPHPVAAAESYLGLVELGVGLIPAGTGTMRLAALAAERAPNQHPSQIQPFVQQFFENVAMARVATSAAEAQAMGYLSPSARVVMNAARRLYVAREEVIRLSNEGYLPPPVRTAIRVLGRSTCAALEVGVRQFAEGGFISDYDQHLALRLAHVITGGDLTLPQDVHEDYLIDLEREVFMQLLGEKRTQERITHLLMTGKPLRN